MLKPRSSGRMLCKHRQFALLGSNMGELRLGGDMVEVVLMEAMHNAFILKCDSDRSTSHALLPTVEIRGFWRQ